MQWEARLEIGTEAEQTVFSLLAKRGFQCKRIGVEARYCPGIHCNPVVRFAPDFKTKTRQGQFNYLEVKSGMNRLGRTCVERECYRMCGHYDKKYRCYLAFVFTDEIRLVRWEDVIIQNAKDDPTNKLATTPDGLWRMGTQTGSGRIFGVIDWEKTKNVLRIPIGNTTINERRENPYFSRGHG